MLEEDALAQSTAIDMGILSDRLEKLTLDQTLRRQMGQAAKQYVEEHCSWRVVVKRYEELWEESLQIARAVNSDHKASVNYLTYLWRRVLATMRLQSAVMNANAL